MFVADSINTAVIKVAPVLVTVSPAPTGTSVAASSASSFFGQTETFTATISVPSGVATPNAGTVTFYDGSASIGQSMVSGGVATITTSMLTVGTHAITASYGGATGYTASASGIGAGAGQSLVDVSGLTEPAGVAVDNMGDLFISDFVNSLVVELTPSGKQTTFFSALSEPIGLAADQRATCSSRTPTIAAFSKCRHLVSRRPSHRVYRSLRASPLMAQATYLSPIRAMAEVLEVNSSGSHPIGDCCFSSPTGLAVDAAGDVFIADTAHALGQTSTVGTIFEVTPSGNMTMVVTGLGEVQDVAVDASGNLYVSEPVTNQVLEIAPSGVQSTVGSNLNGPADLAVDGAGDLFITDGLGDQVLKLTPGVPVTVTADPTSTSVAVNSASSFLGQSETFTATISVPAGATAPSGRHGHVLRRYHQARHAPVSGGLATFTTSGLPLGTAQITASYSGAPGLAASASGIEPASEQSVVPTSGLSQPAGVAVDAEGDLFIADAKNNRVVEVMPDGTQITIGSGLSDPLGVAVDSAGDVFIADTGNGRVVKVPKVGSQSVVASGLNNPMGVAVNAAGDVFISGVSNSTAIEVTPFGTQVTVGSLLGAAAVTIDPAGDVFITYPDEEVVNELTPTGTQTTVLSNVVSLGAIAVDASGNIFTGGFGTNQILMSTPSGSQTNDWFWPEQSRGSRGGRRR